MKQSHTISHMDLVGWRQRNTLGRSNAWEAQDDFQTSHHGTWCEVQKTNTNSPAPQWMHCCKTETECDWMF